MLLLLNDILDTCNHLFNKINLVGSALSLIKNQIGSLTMLPMRKAEGCLEFNPCLVKGRATTPFLENIVEMSWTKEDVG